MSREVLQSKVQSILDEWLSIELLSESIECLDELPADQAPQALAAQALTQSLEGKVRNREQLALLVSELFRMKKLTVGHVESAISEVLELVEDMMIDIPRIHENVGCVCGLLLPKKCFSLVSFHGLCVKFGLVESGMAAKIVAEILKEMYKSSGGAVARGMLPYKELMRFMPAAQQNPEAVLSFAQDKGLVNVFPSLLAATVTKMLGGGSSADDALGWVKGNVTAEALKDGSFARQVYVDVLSLDKSAEMPDEGKGRLLSYVVANTAQDMQCKVLFGVQEFCWGLDKCATGKKRFSAYFVPTAP
jgi:hypothetical protein